MFDSRSGEPRCKARQAMLSFGSGDVPPDCAGWEGNQGKRQRGKCHGEDELNQEVRAEMRLCLWPQAPEAEPGLLQGGTPVSCLLLTRHSFAQEACSCSEVPRFLSPPFSAGAFHSPSLPSRQEIHPWTKSMSLRANKNEQTNKQAKKERKKE